MAEDTPNRRTSQHRPSARTNVESMKLIDMSAWRPANPGSEFEALVARAGEYWARSKVDPEYLPLAAKLARRCTDYLSKLRGGEDWQRLQTFELNGHIYDHNSSEALDWINAALESARAMKNKGAIRRLLNQRVKANYGLQRLREACRDIEGMLESLRNEDSIWVDTDMTVALVCTVQLATCRFYLGEFERVKALLHRAYDLLSQTSFSREQTAMVRSLWANLHRWEGRPHLALEPAKQAAHEFELCGRWDSAGQTYYAISQIALDLARHHPEGTERNNDIKCAIDHTRQTQQVARNRKDKELGALATLSRARIACARKQPPNQREIELVIAGTNSPLLLAQAWTTMGAVHGARDEPEPALNAFRKVGETLKGSDVVAYGLWAQRAVVRYDLQVPQWWL